MFWNSYSWIFITIKKLLFERKLAKHRQIKSIRRVKVNNLGHSRIISTTTLSVSEKNLKWKFQLVMNVFAFLITAAYCKQKYALTMKLLIGLKQADNLSQKCVFCQTAKQPYGRWTRHIRSSSALTWHIYLKEIATQMKIYLCWIIHWCLQEKVQLQTFNPNTLNLRWINAPVWRQLNWYGPRLRKREPRTYCPLNVIRFMNQKVF